ncbi:V-type proton ATPase subunit H-like isoform X4 [Bemisia tabaci]
MFCLRLLPFNPKFAQKMNKLGVIPILADILSDSVREEVTRIILAVFRGVSRTPAGKRARINNYYSKICSWSTR